jgi:hypothetical protein
MFRATVRCKEYRPVIFMLCRAIFILCFEKKQYISLHGLQRYAKQYLCIRKDCAEFFASDKVNSVPNSSLFKYQRYWHAKVFKNQVRRPFQIKY